MRAGLQLVPFSFTGESEAVAIGNMGISGIPVELVPQATRQKAMEDVVQDYPGLIIVDYTLPQAVNGELETPHPPPLPLFFSFSPLTGKHTHIHTYKHTHIHTYIPQPDVLGWQVSSAIRLRLRPDAFAARWFL